MRRYTSLIVAFGLFLITLVVGAQESPTSPSKPTPIIVSNPPGQMIAGTETWQPVQDIQISPTKIDIPFLTNTASDSCSAATILTLPQGDTFNDVTGLSESDSEPDLACMWGTPNRIKGYRTAWYQFTAPHNGRVAIDTFGSTYDTVLAVYKDISPTDTDPCTDFSLYMQTAACEDDNDGFTSNLTLNVRKDEVYYIEVADWEADAGGTKSLRISVLMEPINSSWVQETPMPLARSRHATAVVGSDIYVIGGQTVLGATPQISNKFERYQTNNDTWVTLQNMPGTGYSNTAAAYVDGPNDNGRIYLPSGYTGGSAYNMTHWAYDIQGGYWLTRTAMTDAPFAWAATVAVAGSQPGYYVIGGLNTVDSPTSTADIRNEILFYDPALEGTAFDPWQPKTSMDISQARYAHTAALVDGSVCVVGGITHDGFNPILLSDGICYTPGSGWNITIPTMNYPRYAAGSAVGADGKWYVFGGTDGGGNAVSEVEIYDPANPGAWTVLDVNHDLGGTATIPARAWPRGGMVGSTLWAIGGNNTEQQPLSLVERLFAPTDSLLLPVIFNDFGENTRPDDHFGIAHPMKLNVAQYRNFDTADDYYDVYYFDLSTLTAVTVNLTQVPANSNYDIAIYDANKLLWGDGTNLQGLNESVPLTLTAGRYYIVVERVWPAGDPNTANYRLIVEN